MKAITSNTTNKINNKNFKKLKRQATINKSVNVLKDNGNIINKFLNENKIFNHQMLQWLAFIFMTVDHIGMLLFPQFEVLRELGRIAFPIFCFLLTEGFIHTHDRSKYYLRLLGAALISEIPYNLTHGGYLLDTSKQNVMFELLLGFIALNLAELFKNKFKNKDITISNVLTWCFTLIIGLIAEVCCCDYGMYGIILIMIFYFFKEKEEKRRFVSYIISISVLSIAFFPTGNQIFCILSLIPIYLYNPTPENKLIKTVKYKYLNYFYYPVHFMVLYGLNLIKEYIVLKIG